MTDTPSPVDKVERVEESGVRPGLLVVASVLSAAVFGLATVRWSWSRFSMKPDVVDVLAGLVFLTGGVIVARSTHRQHVAWSLVAAGTAWFIPNLAPLVTDRRWSDALAGASLLHIALLGVAVLDLAPRRPPLRLEWCAGAAAVFVAVSGWTGGWRVALPLMGIALAVVANSVSSPRRIRHHWWVWAAGVFSGDLISAALIRLADPGLAAERWLVAMHQTAVIATVVLLTLVEVDATRLDSIELDFDTSSDLDRVIGAALGVPNVQVALAATGGGWLDAIGERSRLDAAAGTMVLGDDAEPVAALIGVNGIGSPSSSVRHALALARDHAQLRAKVAAQVVELDESRRRILDAQDQARSALVAALELGPLAELRSIEERLAEAGCSKDLQLRARRALAHISQLARGLEPLGASASLDVALAALIEESPTATNFVGVTRPPGDSAVMDPALEATVWFVISEALANVAKQAPGRHRRSRGDHGRKTHHRRGQRRRSWRSRCHGLWTEWSRRPGGSTGRHNASREPGRRGHASRGVAVSARSARTRRLAVVVPRVVGAAASVVSLVVYVPRVMEVPGQGVSAGLPATALFLVCAVLWIVDRRWAAATGTLAAVAIAMVAIASARAARGIDVALADVARPPIAPLLAASVLPAITWGAAAIGCGVLSGLVYALLYDPFLDPTCESACDPGRFTVVHLPRLASLAQHLGAWAVAVVVTMAVLVGPRRRTALGVVVVASWWELGRPDFNVLLIAAGIVALALCRDALAAITAKLRLRELAAALDNSDDLEQTLRSATLDPGLTIEYLVDGDFEGSTEGTKRRNETRVHRDGRPVAVIRTESSSIDVDALAVALNGPARLAFEVERLRATTTVKAQQIEASRSRIVGSGDEARRQLERDIHDGAQQQVLSLGMQLKLALLDAVDDEARQHVLELCLDRVGAALHELSGVAHSLRPFPLEMGASMPRCTRSLPGRTCRSRIGSIPAERLDEQVEQTVIAVVQIAVTVANRPLDVAVVRDAGAVTVRTLGVDVSAMCLAASDRVAAAGGRVKAGIDHVEVWVPCGS